MRYDDVRCPNCGSTKGRPAEAGYTRQENGYMPGGHVTVFACHLCVDALQADLNRRYPPHDGIARFPASEAPNA